LDDALALDRDDAIFDRRGDNGEHNSSTESYGRHSLRWVVVGG
jgi:hypothetical protein